MKKKAFLRRMIMLILFLGALYTTLSTISNVTMNDIFKNEQLAMADGAVAKANQQMNIPTDLEKKVPEEMQVQQAKKSGKSQKKIEQVMKEKYPTEHVVATGYTAGSESTGKNERHPEYGVTYSGVDVTRGMYSTIAADLDVYPLGTILYIPDYGYGIVADKGSAITGNHVDLYYPTTDDVYNEWGKKALDVFIVEMGNGRISDDKRALLHKDETLQVFRADK